MKDYIHSEIIIDGDKISIFWERRKVYNDGTVRYYGEKRIIGSDFMMEDRVYMGCTADGRVCVANNDFSKVEYLGEF